MSLALYGHPFSSYTPKVLIALYENGTPFELRTIPRLRAYRARLLARPSFARAVDEARQFRPLFPLGAPDRD